MTTSRQLWIALSMIEPSWGPTKWPILAVIAAETWDDFGRPDECFVQVSTETLVTRTGLSPNTVMRQLRALVDAGVLVEAREGPRSKAYTIEPDFARWDVAWSRDRDHAMAVLAGCSFARSLSARLGGIRRAALHRANECFTGWPKYLLRGDWFARSLAARPARAQSRTPAARDPRAGAAPRDNYCLNSSNSSSCNEEGTRPTEAQKPVVAAIAELIGQEPFGREFEEVLAAMEGIENAEPIAARLRRERPGGPGRHRQTFTFAKAAAAEVRAAELRRRSIELAAVDQAAAEEAAPDRATQRERIRSLRRGLRSGDTGAVLDDQEAAK